MWRIGAIVLFCLLASPAAAATGDGISIRVPQCPVPSSMNLPDGYLTGKDISEATEASLRSYLIGFINGLQISVLMGTKLDCIELMHVCLARRELTDITHQLVMYVRERPERLGEAADVVTFNALFGRCITEIR